MKNNLKRDAKPTARAGGETAALLSMSNGGTPRNGSAVRAAARSGDAVSAPVSERRPVVRRSARAAAKARARRGTRRMPVEKVIKESQRWLDIIKRHDRLTTAQKKRVVKETIKSFDTYFNTGFLAYRKSVAEAEQYASVEWTGEGTAIQDIMGRSYIDCLGGFGIYSAGIRHPKVVEAVRAQLDHMPLSSQELLDPLRGALAELLGEIAPGNLQKCFFINNGTDAVEGAMKLARLYTEKSGFISTLRGEHDDFTVGDRFDAGVALAYRLTEDVKQFPNYSVSTEVLGNWLGKDDDAGAENESSGGTTTYLSVGFRARFDEHIALTVAPAVPLTQDLNGDQVEARAKLAVALGFSF